MRRIRKLVAAILGGLTATAVVAVANMAGVKLPPEVAGLIVLVAASLSTYLAPANEAPLPTLTAAELRGMADRVARLEREAPR
jgi:hypothetical protein